MHHNTSDMAAGFWKDKKVILLAAVSVAAAILSGVALSLKHEEPPGKVVISKTSATEEQVTWLRLCGVSLEEAKNTANSILGSGVVWNDMTNAAKLPSLIDRDAPVTILQFKNAEMIKVVECVLLVVDQEQTVRNVLFMRNGNVIESCLQDTERSRAANPDLR